MYYVGLFVLSAVVFRFLCFFRVFKMFLVGLATVVRLCFTSDIVLLIDWLYCIDLFNCIAASLFNKLTYLLTNWTIVQQASRKAAAWMSSAAWYRAMPASLWIWCCDVLSLSSTQILAFFQYKSPYQTSRITSNFSSRAFSVSAPSTWNYLPAHIRSIDTLSIFKRYLKFHLFQSAFTV